MTESQLDAQGEARDALSSVVADFGPRVLSDPRMLENRMSDVIPDLERERSLMVAAARSDVAGELTRHVQEQHLDPDTAVQLVSRSLSDRTAIDSASSMWVTSQYAQVLGYHVRPDLPPASSPGPVPPPPPPPQETVTAFPQYGPYQATAPQQDTAAGAAGGPGGYNQPPPAGGGGYQPPAGGGGYYSQPQAPVGGQVPPGGPLQGPPSWQSPRPPKRRNRGLIYGLGAAAAAVVVLVAVAAAGAFSGPGPKPTPTPATTSPHPTTPKPSPTSTVVPLTELLPNDVDDPASQCKASTPPFNAPGLVQGLECTDPGLRGGTLEAYQLNSNANYRAAWASFNNWWGFNNGTPGSNCPPSGSSLQAEGTTTWHDSNFATRAGQVLECEWTGTDSAPQPAYAWTYPTENSFIIAWGAVNSTFSALDKWWSSISESLYSASPSASS